MITDIILITASVVLLIAAMIIRFYVYFILDPKLFEYLEKNHREFWEKHGAPKYGPIYRVKIFWLNTKELPQDKNLMKLIKTRKKLWTEALFLLICCACLLILFMWLSRLH